MAQRLGLSFLGIDQQSTFVFKQRSLVKPDTEITLESSQADDVFSAERVAGRAPLYALFKFALAQDIHEPRNLVAPVLRILYIVVYRFGALHDTSLAHLRRSL